MRGLWRRPLVTVASGMAALVVAAWAAAAQTAGDFYKGRTINLIVGYASGGGYDMYARLLARHMPRYVAGSPNIVVNNLPGAATLKAIEYLDSKAPSDGTALALFDFFQIGNSILTPKKNNLDFRNYHWIGSISEDVSVCYVWHTLNIDSIAELRKSGRVLNFGLTAHGTFNEVRQKMFKKLLGVNVRTISGYPGSSAEKIAVERGELDGGCGGWSSVPADWLRDHKIRTLVRFVPTLPPDMPKDVPYAGDLVSDPHQKRLIEFLAEPAQLGKPIIAVKSVPEDRIKLLQAAFDRTMQDADFLAEAQKLRLDVSPKSAAESREILDELYDAPPDIVTEARALMADNN